MQIYSFNDDRSFGFIADVAVDNKGNIFVLSYKGTQYALTLSNFRGEQISDIKVQNIPKDFSEFRPERIKYINKQLYLADLNSMKIAVTDHEGTFKAGFDIANILGLDEKKRNDSGMAGFSVDSEGNMLFTIPVNFSAYRLSPDGQLITFGTPGSAPGRFGIVDGIVRDEKGNYYVADTLRCVVIIFDRDLRFQKEFGYFGVKPGNLVSPKDLDIYLKSLLIISFIASSVTSFIGLPPPPKRRSHVPMPPFVEDAVHMTLPVCDSTICRLRDITFDAVMPDLTYKNS